MPWARAISAISGSSVSATSPASRPVRDGGGTDGAVADGLNPVVQRILEQLGLLEGGMQLHFQKGRLDAAQRQHKFQLGNGHVGHADVPCKPRAGQLFALGPYFMNSCTRKGRESGFLASPEQPGA